ncbi:MAG: HD-GYP domain-containing protein [Firmicutes bacterium]|nr:HD-GYP domain-containing protein [Bacillota bacterium]
MKLVPTDSLKPGMIIARHIYGSNGKVLLAANTSLKEFYIKRLRELQFSAVYIKSHPDEPEEQIMEPVRQETLVSARMALRGVADTVTRGREPDFKRVQSVVEDIVAQVLGNTNVVYNIADIRAFDDYTFSHSVDVCILSVMCAARMGLSHSELIDLGTGTMLHDLGKLFIPKDVLRKRETLDSSDWEVIRRHPLDGFRILRKQVPLFAAHVAFQHHERFDGSGYPRGLVDNATIDFAKIAAVADSYSAMTADRPYGKALMPHEAISILSSLAGISYNPRVIHAFTQVVVVYPVGSTVLLTDGSTATIENAFRGTYVARVETGPDQGRVVQIRSGSDLGIVRRII